MNRRGFLTTCASLLPLPAFVRAASLWLPPERPRIVEYPWGAARWTQAMVDACGRALQTPGWDWSDPDQDSGFYWGSKTKMLYRISHR